MEGDAHAAEGQAGLRKKTILMSQKARKEKKSSDDLKRSRIQIKTKCGAVRCDKV